MTEKSYLIPYVKRHFWAQKGRFKHMVLLVHVKIDELLMVRIFSSKNGGLRPAPILGIFSRNSNIKVWRDPVLDVGAIFEFLYTVLGDRINAQVGT
jgi:hypothetical protein